MMNKAEVSVLATQAGFGGQLRSTHAVKLETFAGLVLMEAAKKFDKFNDLHITPEVAADFLHRMAVQVHTK